MYITNNCDGEALPRWVVCNLRHKRDMYITNNCDGEALPRWVVINTVKIV